MAFNGRQQIQQDHESMSRTALHAAMEIMAMKPLLEAGGYLAPGTSPKPADFVAALKAAGLESVQRGKAKREADDDSSLSLGDQMTL